jgi:hypothetical protein
VAAWAFACLFLLIFPTGNAIAERGFSAMGAVHSTLRSEMGHEQVWAHMIVYFNGPKLLEYANKINPNISIEDIKDFVNQVGARLLNIRQFAEDLSDGESVKDLIAKALFNAEGDLAAFSHQTILLALKNSKTEGILPRVFKGINV